MMMQRTGLLVVGNVTSLLVAAILALGVGAGSARAVPMAPPVAWGPCNAERLKMVYVDEVPLYAQCGHVSVPIDYAKPDGAQTSLALIRLPATGVKIGSLVLNPGGPGYSGIGSAVFKAATMPVEVRERFDIVGFDPRGVGLSTPAFQCNSGAEKDAMRAVAFADYSPAGVASLEAVEQAFAARCMARMGPEFLANLGVTTVARDLEQLRSALGEDKLNFLGYSYGTLLGSTYAEAYPDKVRAMILDGVVAPDADPIESRVAQSAAFQRAFDEYAADCAKGPGCPLGTDPTKAVAAYHDLINPLVDTPAPTVDPRGLSYADALTATAGSFYDPSYWSDLTEGLRELAAGRGDLLLRLADWEMGRDEFGQYDNVTDYFTAVRCVDTVPILDRAQAVEMDRRLREAIPYESYGDFTGFAPLDWCAFWPVPPSRIPHRPSVAGLPPVLVVSITDDPATPYQAGVDLARDLGAALLTYNAVQHGVVLDGQQCVDQYASDYLVSLTLPPAGAVC